MKCNSHALSAGMKSSMASIAFVKTSFPTPFYESIDHLGQVTCGIKIIYSSIFMFLQLALSA